jgi:hypothetical protein
MKQTKKKRAARILSSEARTPDLFGAVLLIRWSTGSDVKEVARVLNAFPADQQIASFDAKDSEELIGTIQSWLGSGKAQVLYIGSHGNSEGLKPTPGRYPALTWSRLAATLQMSSTPIWVCLGACESACAAEAWQAQPKSFPVSRLLGFESDKTSESDVEDVLLRLMEVSGAYTPGSAEIRAERERITSLEQDISALLADSKQLVVFAREAATGRYERVVESPMEEDDGEEELMATSTEDLTEMVDGCWPDDETAETDPPDEPGLHRSVQD